MTGYRHSAWSLCKTGARQLSQEVREWVGRKGLTDGLLLGLASLVRTGSRWCEKRRQMSLPTSGIREERRVVREGVDVTAMWVGARVARAWFKSEAPLVRASSRSKVCASRYAGLNDLSQLLADIRFLILQTCQSPVRPLEQG
jgi:hypothetical protein